MSTIEEVVHSRAAFERAVVAYNQLPKRASATARADALMRVGDAAHRAGRALEGALAAAAASRRRVEEAERRKPRGKRAA